MSPYNNQYLFFLFLWCVRFLGSLWSSLQHKATFWLGSLFLDSICMSEGKVSFRITHNLSYLWALAKSTTLQALLLIVCPELFLRVALFFLNSLAHTDGNPVFINSQDLTNSSLVWYETVVNTTTPTGGFSIQVNFTTLLPNNATLRFVHAYYTDSFVIDYSYANYTRTFDPHTYKFSIEMEVAFSWFFLVHNQTQHLFLQNWTPQNISNLFLFRLNTVANPYYLGAASRDFTTYLYNANITWGTETLFSSMQLHLTRFAQVDGKVGYCSWYADYNGLLLDPLRALGFKHYFYFPLWTKQFVYDPGKSSLCYRNCHDQHNHHFINRSDSA